jgi:hypothetical protein
MKVPTYKKLPILVRLFGRKFTVNNEDGVLKGVVYRGKYYVTAIGFSNNRSKQCP